MKKLIALAMVFCMLFAFGCAKQPVADEGSAGSAVEAADTSVLRTCFAKDIGTFNIFKTGSSVDLIFCRTLIGDPLLYLNNDFEFEGRVAESYSVNEDQTVYTFNIRQGVKWHDGKDLTVDDVVYSLNLARTGSLTSEFDGYITSIEAVDDKTVVVTLNQPYSSFLYSLFCFSAVVPNGAFEEGGDYNFEEHPIGTGPWMFESYVPGDKVVLKANPDYYLGKPAYDTLECRIMSDASAVTVALETGELDIAAVSTSNYGLIKDNPDIKIAPVDLANITFAGMRNDSELFSDVNVRMAINYAIDKEGLNLVVNEGLCSVANGMSAPGVYGHNADIPGYPYDLAKAKQYLADAGYPDGAGFPEFVIYTNEARQKIAEFVQANLTELGLKTTIEVMEANTFTEMAKNRELDFFITGMGPGVYAINNAALLTTGMTYNFYNYSNARVDELFALAAVSTDTQEVLDAYHEIDELVQADAPFAPLFWSVHVWAYRSDLNLDAALYYTNSDDALPLNFVVPAA